MSQSDYSAVLDELKEAAEKLPEKWKPRIVSHIKVRRKWNEIINKYPKLKDKHGSEKAYQILAEEYNYSEKTIQRILYQNNPTEKIGKD